MQSSVTRLWVRFDRVLVKVDLLWERGCMRQPPQVPFIINYSVILWLTVILFPKPTVLKYCSFLYKIYDSRKKRLFILSIVTFLTWLTAKEKLSVASDLLLHPVSKGCLAENQKGFLKERAAERPRGYWHKPRQNSSGRAWWAGNYCCAVRCSGGLPLDRVLRPLLSKGCLPQQMGLVGHAQLLSVAMAV